MHFFEKRRLKKLLKDFKTGVEISDFIYDLYRNKKDVKFTKYYIRKHLLIYKDRLKYIDNNIINFIFDIEYVNIINNNQTHITQVFQDLYLNIENLNLLTVFPNLEIINLYRTRINDISDITYFVNLKVFKSNVSFIKDASPLLKLSKLEIVEMHSNQIQDKNILKSLKLKHVDLRFNYIFD